MSFPTNLDVTFVADDISPADLALELLGDSFYNHPTEHYNIASEFTAVRAKVGVNNSAVNTSLDYFARNHVHQGTIGGWTDSKLNHSVTLMWSAIQGGTTNEYYHLTAAQHTALTTADIVIAGDSGTPQNIGLGQTATFVGGDGIDTVASATRNLTIAVDGTVVRTGGTLFTLAGDTGVNQTISQGNTLTIAGGTNLNSVGSNTDTVTVNLDDTITLAVVNVSGSFRTIVSSIGESKLETVAHGTGIAGESSGQIWNSLESLKDPSTPSAHGYPWVWIPNINDPAVSLVLKYIDTNHANFGPGKGSVMKSGTEDYAWAEVNSDLYRSAGLSGASGSFTTVDAKTVTVTNGIITNIV